MDGEIQKVEFLAPDGLLAFVRSNFLPKASKGPVGGWAGEKMAGGGGGRVGAPYSLLCVRVPKVPDVRRDKAAWFAYFDEDGSGELSQAEVPVDGPLGLWEGG